MGLFSKIKNIFYDEEVVEVPQSESKEASKPKIEEVILPKRNVISEAKKDEPKTENYTERELFKSETTFNFPIFDEEEVTPTRSRSSILDLDEPKNKSAAIFKETPRTENKVFKPSPVISPIYGILDKSYKKEDIIDRKEIVRHTEKEINYDYVRRKAYGTLEDELENTLNRRIEKPLIMEEESKEVSADNIEDLLTEIEKKANVSIGELEETFKDKQEIEEELYERKTRIENIDEEENSKTLEHDLFNLIDSMYEDKEE